MSGWARPQFDSKTSSVVHNGVEYLSLAAAAHRIGVSRPTIFNWVANGHIATVSIKGRKHVRADQLQQAQDRVAESKSTRKPISDADRALILSDRPVREVAILTGRTIDTINALRTKHRREGGQA